MTKKLLTKILAFVLCVAMVMPVLAACNNYDTGLRFTNAGEYTMNSAMTQLPKHWNPHTISVSNESAIHSYLWIPFYDYIIDENATVTYSEGQKLIFEAARGLPTEYDLSEAERAKYGIPNDGSSGYAWAIPLNPDLKWDTGEAITGQTFVDSMLLLIDPARQNPGAGGITAIGHTSEIANANSYFNAGAPDATILYDGNSGWKTNAPKAGEATLFSVSKAHPYLNLIWQNGLGESGEMSIYDFIYEIEGTAEDVIEYLELDPVADAEEIQEWMDLYESLEDLLEQESIYGYIEVTEDNIDAIKAIADMIVWTIADLGVPEIDSIAGEDFYKVFCYEWDGTSLIQGKSASDVGIFVRNDGNGLESLVYVWTKTKSETDITRVGAGEPNYLVHKGTYEANTVTQSTGLKLTSYNTTKETTRSWGPYTMVSVQPAKEMLLEKNPHFYAFANPAKTVSDTSGDFVGKTYAEKYKGLYTTTRVYYQVVTSYDVMKLMFEKGQLDTITVDIDQVETFNKYPENWLREPGGVVWSYVLPCGRAALKTISESSANTSANLEVLAIPEFREALARALDRKSLTSKYHTGDLPAFTFTPSIQMLRQAFDDTILLKDYDVRVDGIVKLLGLEDQIGAGKAYADKYEAVEWATGYEPEYAKELLNIAYAKLTGATYKGVSYADSEFAGYWDNTKSKIEINCYIPTTEFSATEQLENAETIATWLSATVGTPFEGKVTINIKVAPDAANYYDDLENQRIEMGMYAISSFYMAAVNPLRLYGDNTWYSNGSPVYVTPGVDFGDFEVTIDIKQAYDLRKMATGGNTPTGPNYVISVGEHTYTMQEWQEIYWAMFYDLLYQDNRGGVDLDLLVEDMMAIYTYLEVAILQQAAVIPIYDVNTAIFLAHKIGTVTDQYNQYAGFGSGVKQRTYNYDDAQWEEYVKSNSGKIY